MLLALDFFSVTLVAATGWALGRRVLGRLLGEKGAEWALATALGLGLLAQATFLLGWLGLLRRPLLVGLLIAVHVGCLPVWKTALARWRAWWSKVPRRQLAILLLVAVALLPVVALSLYPPTAFDATNYHLPYVESFQREGRLTFLESVRFPVFPQAIELLFLLAMQLGSDVSAHLVHLLMTMLVAAVLWSWARWLGFGLAAPFAAALWMGNPEVVWLGSAAFVDQGLTLFVVCAVATWHRAQRSESAAEERSWLLVSGVFAGSAAAVKYLGLFFLGALAIATLVRAARRRRFASGAWFGIAAAIVAVPCYLRLFLMTGNPLFPFYPDWFGSSEWTLSGLRVGVGAPQDGLWTSLLFLLKVPWNAVFERAVFRYQAPLSPYYLVLLPTCLPAALMRRWSATLIGLSLLYGLFWLTAIRDLRFLMPALALTTLALSAPLARAVEIFAEHLVPGLMRRSLSGLVVAALLLPGPLYAGYKLWERGPLPLDSEARIAYLRKSLLGFAEVERLNRRHGSDYTLCSLQIPTLRYFAAGRYLGDLSGPHRHDRTRRAARDWQQLHRLLRDYGADYLLVRAGPGEWPLASGGGSDHGFERLPAAEGLFLYRVH